MDGRQFRGSTCLCGVCICVGRGSRIFFLGLSLLSKARFPSVPPLLIPIATMEKLIHCSVPRKGVHWKVLPYPLLSGIISVTTPKVCSSDVYLSTVNAQINPQLKPWTCCNIDFVIHVLWWHSDDLGKKRLWYMLWVCWFCLQQHCLHYYQYFCEV